MVGELTRAFEVADIGPPSMTDKTTLRVLRERVVFKDGSGLDIDKFALITGANAGSLRNWEYGRSSPAIAVEKVAAVCTLLNCTVHEFAAAAANSQRLNNSPEAELQPTRMPTAEERARGIKGARRRGKIA